MPTYDYCCAFCGNTIETVHSMKEEPEIKCDNCNNLMQKQIGIGSYISVHGIKGSLEDHKESEHTKKVKDPERALRSRIKHFGKDEVGDPKFESDPRHIVKKGRVLAGQDKEIDKAEFIKTAAKDPVLVNQALKSLEKT